MQPLKVLVVDDNDSFRSVLKDYLEKQGGIEVIEQAKGGLEAISFTQLLAPHLVLLDISMSGLSGIEVASFIKNFYPRVKVVFVTIHEEASYRELARTLHVDGYVSKNNLKRELPPLLERVKNESLG